MLDQDWQNRKGRIAFAKAAGVAEVAANAVGEVRLEMTVSLAGQGFADALAAELGEMQSRMKQVYEDLFSLAHSEDGRGYSDEIYRLAHRGAGRPVAQADREQLEAIEGRPAAA